MARYTYGRKRKVARLASVPIPDRVGDEQRRRDPYGKRRAARARAQQDRFGNAYGSGSGMGRYRDDGAGTGDWFDPQDARSPRYRQRRRI